MPEPARKVVVVVLNWNGLHDTIECLDSVRQQAYPELEIVVVDNGSRAPEPDLLEARAHGARVIKNSTNVGFAGGCNQGIRYALARGADYVWLLNNDSRVAAGCLAALVGAGESDDRVGLLSPVIYDHAEPHDVQFAGTVVDFLALDRVHLRSVSDMQRRPDADTLALTGTALLIKRQVLDRVGLLDERYFAYVEDTDYSTRAIRAGFTTRVLPEARVYHKEGRSLGGLQSPIREYLLARNWYLFWRTHLTGRCRRGFRRRYAAWILDRALAARLVPAVADQSLNGAWAALRGRWGSWERQRPMPAILRGLIHRGILAWHPYLWIRLLAGDLRGVASEALLRISPRRGPSR